MKLWLFLLPIMLLSSCATMTPQEPAAMPISEACLQGNDFGDRDARGGLSKDPYRYRREIASQNWSDFVDGYLHGYGRAGRR
jgi:hypothetical protein